MERWIGAANLEVRAEGDAQVIEGYAAVFNSLSEDLGGFREQIAPGAFKSSMDGDIRALWNHDTGQVLGRTTAGTLQLVEDKRGLKVRIMPPKSASGLVESVARGDVDAMSFGFTIDKDSWQKTATGPVRTLHGVNLKEVSIVAFPAYKATSVEARDLWGALPAIPDIMKINGRAPVIETRRAPGNLLKSNSSNKGITMATATLDKLAPVDMRRKAQSSLDRATTLDLLANSENRSMSADEQGEYDGAIEEHRRLSEAATRAETLGRLTNEDAEDAAPVRGYATPNINVLGNREVQEARAHASFIRTGDPRSLMQLRASNAVDMAEGAVATGGAAVPTGMYNRIVGKAGNYSLLDRLGLTKIPGKGKDVTVPVELASSTVNPFIQTNEKAAKDKDSPSLASITMTLLKYTKVVPLTTELMEDEDANLLNFIEDYVARAMADTINSAIITAALKTTAPPGFTILPLTTPTAAPFVADLTQMYYGLREPYADNGKFVMRRATEGAYATIQGQPFVFAPTPAGGAGTFLGAPVYNVADVPALALNAKSAIFADWSYMGYRQGASIGFLRDPYSRVLENVVQLIYEFRFVAQVLQPEAGVIGQKPAA
jgi:HK97 family phage major capsid protein/HK97 family phage prohead protease